MKKILSLILLVILTGCVDKTTEIIIGNGHQTARELLAERGICLPWDIDKGNKIFSEAIIVYGPPPNEWTINENWLVWVTGGRDPDSMISFRFNLRDKIIAQK